MAKTRKLKNRIIFDPLAKREPDRAKPLFIDMLIPPIFPILKRLSSKPSTQVDLSFLEPTASKDYVGTWPDSRGTPHFFTAK
jgi:hypothetical protein